MIASYFRLSFSEYAIIAFGRPSNISSVANIGDRYGSLVLSGEKWVSFIIYDMAIEKLPEPLLSGAVSPSKNG